jgi:hypothetical protein
MPSLLRFPMIVLVALGFAVDAAPQRGAAPAPPTI